MTMKKNSRHKLSPANLEIMKIIWDKGELTVTEVLKTINKKRTHPLRRTTVQVQMARLEEYGWLKRRKKGRTYYYSATAGKQKTKRDILNDIKTRVFGGSRTELVRCLLEDTHINSEEIEELRELIENHDKVKT
jgi:predicted transcriptional regulator